jgi:hypothetical protein
LLACESGRALHEENSHMTEDQREIRRKKQVIDYAEKNGNIKAACRRFCHSFHVLGGWALPLRSSTRAVGEDHRHAGARQLWFPATAESSTADPPVNPGVG